MTLTIESVSCMTEVPNIEKHIKARSRRPSAFIVLEPLMKHEGQVVYYEAIITGIVDIVQE